MENLIYRKLMNTDEASGYLKVAMNSLKLSRHSGMLCGRKAPPFRKMGRKVVYFIEDLDNWLEELPVYTNTSEFEGGNNG